MTNKIKTVIGFDMGKNTQTYSVIRLENKTLKLVDTARCPWALSGLTSEVLDQEFPLFKKSFLKILREHKPDIFLGERFMVRGKMFGASCENISCSLGIMYSLCYNQKISPFLITSSQWKNAFNRVVKHPLGDDAPVVKKGKTSRIEKPLDGYYKLLKPTLPHFLDSYLIALYGFGRHYQYKNPFELFHPYAVKKLKMIERAKYGKTKVKK